MTRIDKVPATGQTRWVWQWINQWPAVIRPKDYNFIDIFYEYDKAMGNAHEIRIVLLGLGFRWAVNFRSSALLSRMISEVDQMSAELRDEEGQVEDGPKEDPA